MKLVADEKDYEAWVAHRQFVDGKWTWWEWNRFGDPAVIRRNWLTWRWIFRIVVRAFAEVFRERRHR